MTTKVRVINWPEEFKDIKVIEDQMICGICYEFMETSVMTPCYHNYCSLCIRKYLHYKTECPVCFHNVFDKDLYINRNLDSIIQSFLQVREKIASLVQNRVIFANPEIANPSPTKTIITQSEKPNILCSPEKRVFNKLSLNRTPSHSVKDTSTVVKTPNQSDSPSTSHQYKLSPSLKSPNSSGPARQLAKIFNTPKVKRPEVTVVVDIEKVACPVCAVEVPKTQINKHLDACLSREDSSSRPNNNETRRPPLPKLVFRVMKESELRKKLKEFGLSTNGDRKALENRFTRYSTIYNAENDKINPRSIAELIKQCEQEERLEKKIDGYLISTPSTSGLRLQVDRNAKEEIIEEAQKKYIEANKSSFDKLIEDVRNRQRQKADTQENESTVKKEQLSPSEDSTPDNQNNSIDNANTSIESDSDQSCPLQHYKSDDPVKFLSRNTINSSPGTSASNSPIKNRTKSINVETERDALSLSPVLKKKNGKKTNTKKNLSSTQKENLEATKVRNEILRDFIGDDDSSTEFETSMDDMNSSKVKVEIRDDVIGETAETDVNKSQPSEVLKSIKNSISNSEDDLDLEVSHIIEDSPHNSHFQNSKENSNPHEDLRSISTRLRRTRTKTKRFGRESEDESETCSSNPIDKSLKRRRTARINSSNSPIEENFQPRRRPYRRKRENSPISEI